jgi:hypothetical protein
MTIRMTVEAKDPEVENILAYLQTQTFASTDNKISALERAVMWLKSSQPDFFRCDPAESNSGDIEIVKSV